MALPATTSPCVSLPHHSRGYLPLIRAAAATPSPKSLRLHSLPIRTANGASRRLAPLGPARYGHLVTEDLESQMGEGFFEAVEELERMVRDPSDVLGERMDRLSTRELQLVLVYFAQEGRDSYCALEVFEWLRKENKVDSETMELMGSIACGWIEKLIAEDCAVEEVVVLLYEIECVGLEPGFSMIEKIVSLYWEKGKKEGAVEFVKLVMGRRNRESRGSDSMGQVDYSEKGGPVGYLAWKMMIDGNYMDAVRLVIDLKTSGLEPEVYSYLIAMTALVKEQKEFSKSLRQLRGSARAGLIAQLDEDNLVLLEEHQAELLRTAARLSTWALQGGGNEVAALVHERLLSIYTCAGYGLEAERQLWQMKICGKQPDKELYDIILAICASQNEEGAVSRLLAGVEDRSAGGKGKTLLWLLRGYLKGGYHLKASDALMKMLDNGLRPEYVDRAAVLQGLRKSIQESGSVESYLKLCKVLSDKELTGPCIVYLYINTHRLWVMRAL